MVLAHEGFLVRPAVLGLQGGADEVGDVGHRRTETDRLPVEHGHPCAAEHQVVEPEVAVHDGPRHRPVGEVAIEGGDEALGEGGDVGLHPLGVAFDEAGVQHLDEHVEPGRRFGVGPAQPFELQQRRIAPAWTVERRQLGDHRRRLVDRAPGDLVAGPSGREVLEQHDVVAGRGVERAW